MRRFIVYILLCYSLSAWAQHTLSGTVVSKTDNNPIEMATVRLFVYPKANMPAPPAGMPAMPTDMPDSVLVQGAQTTYDGMFVLNNIRPGVYKLYISSVGFGEVVRDIEMPNQHLDLPTIRLIEQSRATPSSITQLPIK